MDDAEIVEIHQTLSDLAHDLISFLGFETPLVFSQVAPIGVLHNYADSFIGSAAYIETMVLLTTSKTLMTFGWMTFFISLSPISA